MAKNQGHGWVAAALATGALLHRLHEAIDGFEWIAEVCWCRLRPGSTGAPDA